jgi:hypothetical protein
VFSYGDPATDLFFPAAVLHRQQPYETVEVIKIFKPVDVSDFSDQ